MSAAGTDIAVTAKARQAVGGRERAIIATFVLLALAPIAAQAGPQGYIIDLITRMMIFAIAALSLDLILGYGAMVSFGHAAFIGLGAYAVGILASHGVTDFVVQLAAALAAAAVFAFVTGALSLRTKGVYFIMITLAFSQMLFFFGVSLSAYGGDDGLSLPERSRLFGLPLFSSDKGLFYATLACLIGCYLLCRAIVASRFGRVLRGARENPVRMTAIGFSPYRFQLVAYVISGMMAALAGALLANQTGFVSPAYMSWQRSGELLAMTIFGGVGTLVGPIIGAMAFLALEEWLAGLTEHWKMIFGPLLVCVVLFARGGIMGLAARIGGKRDG
ncbi:MAG: branched-chain amino acid ABC transporter permease [Rhizobiales bacterium 65-9]|nr:branched-chain amino acid ABC transporter permease [Hyphomicrobiales bacterium]OJY37876.1 MAG: branched-chain amino acid ABC transporter permease [Rhizobiales bacterium 65-9]